LTPNIRPYVWHVSNKLHDFEIAQHGLIQGRDGYVYANNHAHSLGMMWPIPIDSWDYMGEPKEVYMLYYTFWRIDTIAAACEWELDLKLAEDVHHYNALDPSNYIRTPSAIPSSAIMPFTYSNEPHASLEVQLNEGVACIEPLTEGLPLQLDQSLVLWSIWRQQNVTPRCKSSIARYSFT
jgi:hypothetical protein